MCVFFLSPLFCHPFLLNLMGVLYPIYSGTLVSSLFFFYKFFGLQLKWVISIVGLRHFIAVLDLFCGTFKYLLRLSYNFSPNHSHERFEWFDAIKMIVLNPQETDSWTHGPKRGNSSKNNFLFIPLCLDCKGDISWNLGGETILKHLQVNNSYEVGVVIRKLESRQTHTECGPFDYWVCRKEGSYYDHLWWT